MSVKILKFERKYFKINEFQANNQKISSIKSPTANSRTKLNKNIHFLFFNYMLNFEYTKKLKYTT